jgi:hypothetical protein
MSPDESGGLIALWVRVFNATFNNISAILWWSVLLVKPEYPEKITDLSQVTDKFHHITDQDLNPGVAL